LQRFLKQAEATSQGMKIETQALHTGYDGDPSTKSVAVPIYQTVAYEFDSAEHAAALFNLEVEGYRYSRISNPTVAVLERRLAAMEGGVGAVCLSSGQAALHNAILTLAEPGRNIISVPQLYGTTHTLFTHVLPRLGLTVKYGASDRAEDIAALIDENSIAVFCESIGNPAGNICDIESLAHAAHAHGLPLIVDNTVASPVLLRPIEFGADIIVQSLSKFLGGHGTTLGGAIIDSGNFPWGAHMQRFAAFSTPDLSYHGLIFSEHFGKRAYIERVRNFSLRTTGACLSPLSAFLLLQGVETVALRVERHVQNARRVAEILQQDARVAWVNYAGFPGSPFFELSRKYLKGQAPSLLTFGLHGGMQEAERFYDALRLVKRLVNLGDAKSLACHPASTTHRQMTSEEQRKAGVLPEMIRLSVGIEHIDDIIADIDQALNAAGIRLPAPTAQYAD
jgi:O-acetylhomoserine (thiol)-lyase